MELNEMEKKMLFQVEGDYQAKVRVLSDRERMDLVRDIQKNYRLPTRPGPVGKELPRPGSIIQRNMRKKSRSAKA